MGSRGGRCSKGCWLTTPIPRCWVPVPIPSRGRICWLIIKWGAAQVVGRVLVKRRQRIEMKCKMRTPLMIQVKTRRLRSRAQAMMMKNKGVGLKATSNTTQVVVTNIQVASLVQVSSRTHQVSSRAHPSLHISSSILMCNTRTSGSSSSRRTWPGTKTGRLLSSFKDSRLLDTIPT